MGAVINNQIESVKMILSFNYKATDPVYFERYKNCKDGNGNTAIHLAYKFIRQEIVSMLIENNFYDETARNLRGLLPMEMNHKKLYEDEEEFDKEPDYLFVVKK